MPKLSKKSLLGATPAPAVPPSDIAPSLRVLRQFRIVMNAVKTHFRQVEKQAGVGGAQLWALSLIQAAPGIGVNDLARGMDVHQSTASNLLKILTQQELVVIERTDTDRRAAMLYLLPKGQAILKMAPAPFAGVLPDALHTLDPATLLRLEEDLNTLIAALHADQEAANTPLADL
jgi:DNA-binding MarR family transcriptional regulator